VVVVPMLGDWKLGPVNGVCFCGEGFTTAAAIVG